jgi:hypothetical protein
MYMHSKDVYFRSLESQLHDYITCVNTHILNSFTYCHVNDLSTLSFVMISAELGQKDKRQYTAFGLILVQWVFNSNQCKCAFIAQLPYLPVRGGTVDMWHLWLVLKLEERGDDFQILETASLQIL